MSEALGQRPDVTSQINTETRSRLVTALGELTLQNVSNGARADYFQAAYGGLENNFVALQHDVERLRAEIEQVKATSVIPDVSKLDFDTLVTELKHRGYSVTADTTPVNLRDQFAREDATEYDANV